MLYWNMPGVAIGASRKCFGSFKEGAMPSSPGGSQGKAQRQEERIGSDEIMNKKAFCNLWRVTQGKLLF